MKSSQLNRVLNVIRHTGDRLVVMDAESEEVIVMMSLTDYENLLNHKKSVGTSMDTSRVQVAEVEESEAPESIHTTQVSTPAHFAKKSGFEAFNTTKKPVNLFPQESPEITDNWLNDEQNKPSWVEENLDDIASDEDEDKFYLEPIE